MAMKQESSAATAADAAVAHWVGHSERQGREGKLPGHAHAFVTALRASALARFTATGFPTTRDEEWRFTRTDAIAGLRFEESETSGGDLDEGVLDSFRLATSAAEIVLVDGRFAPSLSVMGKLGMVRAGSLARALEDDSGWVKLDWIEPWLGRLGNEHASAFAALNLAVFADGAFVRIPAGMTLERPIHLLHVTTAGGALARCSTPRSLVLVETAAEARLVESYVSLDGGAASAFTNTVTEMVLAEDSSLEHDRLVRAGDRGFHVATIEVRQDRASRYVSRNLCLKGALVRTDLNVLQAGEGTETTLDGLYVARGSEHVDNHTRIDHALPHGTSHELYKGILDGQAHGVFNGKVVVRQDAQKTDSRQTNRNLLLSRDAVIDTKPELQIFADDVKCAHGATIGQLDDVALFYLRSRGIGEEESKSLLTFAFASEVVQRIRDESLRAHVRELLLARLPGGELLAGAGSEAAKEDA